MDFIFLTHLLDIRFFLLHEFGDKAFGAFASMYRFFYVLFIACRYSR